MNHVRNVGLLLAPMFLLNPGGAQTTTRVSVDSAGAQADGESGSRYGVSISADGRYIAFESRATNLVANDTNGFSDVFVRDRLSGTTERVSVDSAGAQGNSSSTWPWISADGRFVTFSSYATNLVAGDTNATCDVFVRDRLNGTTERVSVDSSGVQGNDWSGASTISADGRYVVFDALASNLVPGDTNAAGDVFVHDRQTGVTELVSIDTNGIQGNANSSFGSISDDGRYVCFWSEASNLIAGDTNYSGDVFVRDRMTGTTELVSVDSSGTHANDDSAYCLISGDGRSVVFESGASNLAPGDTNGDWDVFVHDRLTGSTEFADVNSSGAQGNHSNRYPSISSDGRFVAFESTSTNLVTGDTNAQQDIFVRDRLQSTTTRASVDTSGVQANLGSYECALSGDGRFVVFASGGSNLVTGDTNGVYDIFLRSGVSPPLAICFGDGSAAPCPCGNTGATGRGCENSASTGGAVLDCSGYPSLTLDNIVFTSSGELPTSLSILLQGNTDVAPLSFGDGLRCASGMTRRLFIHSAVNGAVVAPSGSDATVSARSAALGDPIAPGSARFYQVYYRDANSSFCPAPQGNNYNISSGRAVIWDS